MSEPVSTGQVYTAQAGIYRAFGRSDYGAPPLPTNFEQLVWEEQWATSTPDPTHWHIYNNEYFGGPSQAQGGRIQKYMAGNIILGAGSAGATGRSCKMRTIETDAGSGTLPTAGDAGTRYSYTAAMMDSKTAGMYYPRYCQVELRCKFPHGQGLWPAFWFTAKNGGYSMCEIDFMENFCAQLPGHNKTSVHGSENNGSFRKNRIQLYTGQYFENPTHTPGWFKWNFKLYPVTDGTGNTLANPALPSPYVRLQCYLEDGLVGDWVDPSSLYWTTNGGNEDSFWNLYFQGSQVDGEWVGHPHSPLGYDHWRDTCIVSGTPPDSCSINYAYSGGGHGEQNIAPSFVPPAADFEVDYIKIWKFTG